MYMNIFDTIKKAIQPKGDINKEIEETTGSESYSKRVLEAHERLQKQPEPSRIFRRPEDQQDRYYPSLVKPAETPDEEAPAEEVQPTPVMEEPPREDLRMAPLGRELAPEGSPELLPAERPAEPAPVELPKREETPEQRRLETALMEIRELREQNKLIIDKLSRIEERMKY